MGVELLAVEESVLAEGLTTTDWVVAGSVFVGGIVVGRVLRSVLTRVLDRPDTEHGAALAVGRVAATVTVTAGVVAAMAVLDARLAPLLGALGIGGIAVALATQTILENGIASVILRMRRPFRRGDEITVNEVEGTVEEVNFRTVVLRSYDGERVLAPCGQVIRANITNHTVLGRRRTTLTVAVAFATDLEEARRVLLDAVAKVDGVLERPEPDVWVETFAESGIELAVRFWHLPDIATLWRVRSGVAVAAKQALDRAAIEIPFPQLDLHLSPSPRDEAPASSTRGADGDAPGLPRER